MFNYPRFDLDDTPPECADQPDLFFPGTPHPLSIEAARAKAMCARCPYREQCREYATAAGEAGIWGGTTEAERRHAARAGREAHGLARAVPDPEPSPRPRHLSRYTLYEVTQLMICNEGLTVRECATRLGLTYEHVSATRRQVMREIEGGRYRPAPGVPGGDR